MTRCKYKSRGRRCILPESDRAHKPVTIIYRGNEITVRKHRIRLFPGGPTVTKTQKVKVPVQRWTQKKEDE